MAWADLNERQQHYLQALHCKFWNATGGICLSSLVSKQPEKTVS